MNLTSNESQPPHDDQASAQLSLIRASAGARDLVEQTEETLLALA